MIDIGLMLRALEWKEFKTVAYLMIGLYAEYCEGFIESSREKFNKHIDKMPIEVLLEMKCQNKEICFESLDEILDHHVVVRLKALAKQEKKKCTTILNNQSCHDFKCILVLYP